MGALGAKASAMAAAFVIGALGPLVGADLLQRRRVESFVTAVMSIAGAVTFDSIVLAANLAAYLA